MAKTFQQRLDGWVNTLTGLGGRRDKRLAAEFLDLPPLDDATLSGLYNNNDLCHRIVSRLPEDAFRQGYTLKLTDDDEGEKATNARKRLDELDADSKMEDAAIWGRLYGLGAVLLGVSRGKPETPLRGGSLEFLTVLDKRDLAVNTWYADPFAPRFGQPETYRLQARNVPGGSTATGTIIHESRLILFGGAHTTRDAKIANNGFDYSVLQRIYEVIRDYESGFHGVAYLLQDANQAVYGVEGLLEILASDGGEVALSRRMEMIELSRSVCKALLIDTKETFERKPTSFTGIPDVLDRMSDRLAGASEYPATVLFGGSPDGMNATGDGDIRLYYDRVRSFQNKRLTPAYEKLLGALLPDADNWTLEWASLYQPTDKETAELRHLVGTTDKLYVEMGTVTPEEIGMSRFKEEGWSMETTIDLELRAQIDEVNSEKMREQAKNPETIAGQPGTLVPQNEPDNSDPSSGG